MNTVLSFAFKLYHGTGGSQPTGPAPSYASDPTGIFVFFAGILVVVGLMIYFSKQNKD